MGLSNFEGGMTYMRLYYIAKDVIGGELKILKVKNMRAYEREMEDIFVQYPIECLIADRMLIEYIDEDFIREISKRTSIFKDLPIKEGLLGDLPFYMYLYQREWHKNILEATLEIADERGIEKLSAYLKLAIANDIDYFSDLLIMNAYEWGVFNDHVVQEYEVLQEFIKKRGIRLVYNRYIS